MQDDAEDPNPLGWVDPPLHEEEIAALRAMGARFARGGALRDFEPVKQRPRWLALVYRILRIDSGEMDDWPSTYEEAPPDPGLTAEERAALNAIGWREGRGPRSELEARAEAAEVARVHLSHVPDQG
jgi:hypothetical protein